MGVKETDLQESIPSVFAIGIKLNSKEPRRYARIAKRQQTVLSIFSTETNQREERPHKNCNKSWPPY